MPYCRRALFRHGIQHARPVPPLMSYSTLYNPSTARLVRPAASLAGLLAVGHQTCGSVRAAFLRPSHHRPRFQPMQVASARLRADRRAELQAATMAALISRCPGDQPQALLATQLRSAGPPMRDAGSAFMEVNTIGTAR